MIAAAIIAGGHELCVEGASTALVEEILENSVLKVVALALEEGVIRAG